ncbi:MAG: alpha-mannosidase [Clostridia bacterium]|nr:alpha-mannosidase [Clostridia bacterium]
MDERLQQLFDEIYTPIEKLDVTAYITKEPLPYSERKNGRKAKLKEGDKWGELWDCAWMNMTCAIPANAEGKLALLLDVGGEGCVFDKNGNPFKGITNKDSSYSFHLGMPGKVVVYPSEEMLENGKLDIWVDCGANDLFGENVDSPFELIGILHKARLATTDERKRSLYYDLEVIKHLADATKEESLKNAANECFEKAIELYKTDISSAEELTKAFLSQKSNNDFEITALGHAHIDLAWLWPLRETKRKAARTFSTLMRNSAIYKNYLFGVSQPQMLEWVKDEHPSLYAEMKKLYADGRLELQGGFWVESDTNVPSGESLIRQMLYGKKFFRDEFGYEQEILWIPDVFGYSAQLPQIMAKSGVKYFLTIKMSWNAVNLFPHSTFNWVGLDGSSILTHMPPEGNYNSAARAESFINTEEKFRERDIDNKAMLLYGIGDGGGGPGMEHLERLEREYDLIGLPKTKQGFAIDFFREIEKEKSKYPEYAGELYLEKHQGTYTTQSRNKRYNRKCEFAFHDAEIMSTLSACTKGFDYPKERLEKLWKEVLLYQFHDIIPGSSIKRVYDETDVRYEYILGEIKKIEADAFEKISSGDGQCVFNPSPFEFNGFIENGSGYSYISAPAMGFGRVENPSFEGVKATESTIENDLIKITFNKNGGIDSVIAKGDGFEYLDGEGNVLNVYEDNENAWEVPEDFAVNPRERFELQGVSVKTVDGVAERTSVYKLGNSTLSQTVAVYPNSARVDFKTEVDWNETHKMLRTSFPLAAKSDLAKCEIQYGSIERPTHRRDSFAKAKKEICAHKWVDISNGEHGAALLNDCKYGHRVWDSVLDINLLRSSMYPGIDADKGKQVFTYSLLVHGSDYVNHITKEGYALNDSAVILNGAVDESLIGESLVKLDCNGSVAIDWMKLSEDGSGIILRAYEFAGKECEADISLNGIFGAEKAMLCDNMENEISEVNGKVSFKPFDIITLKFTK